MQIKGTLIESSEEQFKIWSSDMNFNISVIDLKYLFKAA